MAKTSDILLHTSDAMRRLLRPSYLAVKELLVSPTWRYLHRYPESKNPDQPPQTAIAADDDYKEIAGIMITYTREFYDHPHPPSDVLLYYSEGFLPFLQIFYSRFYQKGHDNQCELEKDTTDKLYTSILVCKQIVLWQF